MMRALFAWITALTLIASCGLLAADVLFGYRTVLGLPSLLVLCLSLAGMAYALHRSRQKLFLRALDSYVQREALREMEQQLARARVRERSRDDSTPSHPVATLV